jgi:hypothetical protein
VAVGNNSARTSSAGPGSRTGAIRTQPTASKSGHGFRQPLWAGARARTQPGPCRRLGFGGPAARPRRTLRFSLPRAPSAAAPPAAGGAAIPRGRLVCPRLGRGRRGTTLRFCQSSTLPSSLTSAGPGPGAGASTTRMKFYRGASLRLDPRDHCRVLILSTPARRRPEARRFDAAGARARRCDSTGGAMGDTRAAPSTHDARVPPWLGEHPARKAAGAARARLGRPTPPAARTTC